MERNNRCVHPGEFYRHFKNKLYQILAVAIHSETREEMVVYQALYGDFKVYVRPYDMFVSEVDHEKYPEVQQKYRFERVEFESDKPGMALVAASEPNPELLRFLDAESFEKQMECLKALGKTASQSDLDSLYVALDMKSEAGSVQEQLDAVARFLSMQNRYDGSRLR